MHTYNGQIEAPVDFNYYDVDPTAGMAVPVASGASYDPGAAGDFWVTAAFNGCESVPTPVSVAISTGFQQLACNSMINVSLDDACETILTPEVVLQSTAQTEFIEVEIVGIDSDMIAADLIGNIYDYKAIDVCNGNSCWGQVRIEEKNPPIITVRDTMVMCGVSTDVADLDPFLITDCSPYETFINDVELGELCNDDRRIERHISATDAYGNTSSAVQIIMIKALDPAEIVPPTDVVTTTCGITSMADILDFTGNIEDAFPTIDGIPLVPGEYCNFLVIKKDEILEACDLSCSNSVKLARTWKILDWCADGATFLEFTQVIHAKDIEGPVIEPFNSDTLISTDPWTCTADVELPLPVATDNCTLDGIEFIITGPVGITIENGVALDLPIGSHLFNYRATDCCGNFSQNNVFYRVDVYDGVAPTAIALQEIVVHLVDDPNDPGVGAGKIFAESVDNGSFDMCGDVTLEVRRESDPCRTDSDEFGEFVKFCCRDLDQEIKVILQVTDEAGNKNTSWVNVLVEDKTVEIECNDFLTFCHEDLEEAIRDNRPTASGICSSKPIEEVSRDYTDYNEMCKFGTIVIEYQVRDRPDVTCTQVVTVEYKGGFSCEDVNWPEETRETDCLEVGDEPFLDWDAGACELIGWTVESDTFRFESDACSKIINTYTVIDWCIYDGARSFSNNISIDGGGISCNNPNELHSSNGIYTFVEVIKLVDTIAPVIGQCEYPEPFPIHTNTCSGPVTLTNNFTDASSCGETWIKWELTVTSAVLKETYIMTGRSLAGDDVSVTIVDLSGNEVDFPGPMSTHEFKWKIYDGCGNSDFCEGTFMVEDAKEPTPYCVSISSALMKDGLVELWAIDFNIASEDNCTDSEDLYFTFDDVSPDKDYLDEEHYFTENGIIDDLDRALELYNEGKAQLWIPSRNSSAMNFTCDDHPLVDLFITVWDEKWNHDACLVELTLQSTLADCPSADLAMISGVIVTEDGSGVNDVDVSLSNETLLTEEFSKTDPDGKYAFPDNPMTDSYMIIPSKKGIPMDGVTTEDVILIQQAIMNESLYDSPYDVIAADVDDNKVISAIDVILIQRLIAGLLPEFKAGEWKFIPADMELTVQNALSASQTFAAIESLDNDMTSLDFIGVKIGDLTGDASTNARQGVTVRKKESLDLLITDRFYEKGEYATIEINLADLKDILGYQFSLDLSLLSGISIDDAPIGTVYGLVDGKISLSYADAMEGVRNDQVLVISGTVEQSRNLSDLLKIDNNRIQAEAYTSNRDAHKQLQLRFINENESPFILGQNVPNPFRNATVIPFYLPEDGKVDLQVRSLDGRLIKNTSYELRRGENSLSIDAAELNMNSGVYYYQLKYNGLSHHKKMIVVK